ncbi:MAG: hypothetical protein IPN46_14125 [Saprospiraceae bacterium]|nr:hypothetical protein [Saprospiraceae bacterium]
MAGKCRYKESDITIIYCLAPRSYIHSIWRATKDGIADPFFHFYSSIEISEGIKVEPISFNELKSDEYFSKHPLVRKIYKVLVDIHLQQSYKKINICWKSGKIMLITTTLKLLWC